MTATNIASRSVYVKRIPQDMVAKTLAKNPWLWTELVLKANVPPAVKVAAFALLKFINSKSGNCWAGYATIGATCGTNARGIRYAFTALRDEKIGLIRVVRRGAKETNEIELALPPGLGLAVETLATGKTKVTVVTTQSDGREDVRVMVAPTSSNFRSNSRLRPRKKENNNNLSSFTENQNSKIVWIKSGLPYSSPPAPSVPEVPNQPVETECLPRATSEKRARAAVVKAAADSIGWHLGDPPLPDGRFIDAVIIGALGPKTLAELVQKCLRGTLARFEIDAALSCAGIGQGSGLDRRRAA